MDRPCQRNKQHDGAIIGAMVTSDAAWVRLMFGGDDAEVAAVVVHDPRDKTKIVMVTGRDDASLDDARAIAGVCSGEVSREDIMSGRCRTSPPLQDAVQRQRLVAACGTRNDGTKMSIIVHADYGKTCTIGVVGPEDAERIAWATRIVDVLHGHPYIEQAAPPVPEA